MWYHEGMNIHITIMKGGKSMGAIYSDELKELLRQFMWDRHLTVTAVSTHCKGVPSNSTLNNWAKHGRVSEQTVREFLRHYPELNSSDWLCYFRDARDAKAIAAA